VVIMLGLNLYKIKKSNSNLKLGFVSTRREGPGNGVSKSRRIYKVGLSDVSPSQFVLPYPLASSAKFRLKDAITISFVLILAAKSSAKNASE
jgi:hypothetical protein